MIQLYFMFGTNLSLVHKYIAGWPSNAVQNVILVSLSPVTLCELEDVFRIRMPIFFLIVCRSRNLRLSMSRRISAT